MANIVTPISIDVRTQKPLEPKRGPVQTKADLINPETWSYDTDSDNNKVFYVYAGMIVPVIKSRDIYMLIDPIKILDPDFSGWVSVGGMGGDNLIFDGGSARDVYTTDQYMDAGNALNEII